VRRVGPPRARHSPAHTLSKYGASPVRDVEPPWSDRARFRYPGGATVAIAWELNAYRPAPGAVVAATMFGIRGLALHRHWHGPCAWKR
jgi:hypothetical protein